MKEIKGSYKMSIFFILSLFVCKYSFWIPAYAGMTEEGRGNDEKGRRNDGRFGFPPAQE
jgi:hypothetical protein